MIGVVGAQILLLSFFLSAAHKDALLRSGFTFFHPVRTRLDQIMLLFSSFLCCISQLMFSFFA
jgi:hypothetical protein